MRCGLAASLLALLVVGTRGGSLCAEEEVPAFKDVRAASTKAFKPLGLPAAAKLEKTVTPQLPEGIVIESGPFDRLVERLLAPQAEQLALRERSLDGLAQHPSPQAGKLLEVAFKALAKEERDLLERIEDAEARYAQVYNQGYMESGERERRERKLTAVVIPLYRTLLARQRDLRARAVVALAAMRDGEAFAWLSGAARGHADAALRGAAAGALGTVGGEEARTTLDEVLRRDAVPSVRAAALVALAGWPVRAMKDAVLAALADEAWEVRALAVAMCVRANLVEAAGPLIEALAREEGRLRKDIDDALFRLVGARLYADVDLWRRWWGENRESVDAKARALAEAGAYDEPLGAIETWSQGAADDEAGAQRRGGTSVFYGIETWSKRILYVVDISRSMDDKAAESPPRQGDARAKYAEPAGDTKMAIARWQLHRAVEELPDDAAFNIVVYSESYALWQPEMVQARGKAKGKAHAFIDGLVANGTTNIGDSLDKALEVAGTLERDARGGAVLDTVFLLSDGDPNRGRITNLARLLEDVVARNRRARLVFHAIGIGEAAGSSFLADLARATGGRYVAFR